MQITAAVLRAADGPYTIESLDLADPGPGEILVRVAGAGMCHTDLLGRVPGDLVAKPVVLGHEGSGVVEAVGPGVTGVTEGDHVVMSFDSCGACDNCRAGVPGACPQMMALNMLAVPLDGTPRATTAGGEAVHTRWFGQSSFASHALGTVHNVVPVSRDVPLEQLGPLGCGVQTGAASVLVSLGVRAGDSIAIFGAGAVGLAAVMAARVAGATTIVAVDLHESRLDLARELGATHVLNGADQDIAGQIRAISGGEGVQYSFDSTAVPEVVATAVASLRTTGVCGLVGVGAAEYTLDANLLLMGRTVKGIIEGDAVPQTFIPKMIELWRQGRFPFERLITSYPLDQINQAEADAQSGKVVKPVLVP
ncbi:NAD(P)-dependent alcohol dehydrogenase [Actinomadura livida]|uniref:Aryl-alcohol dehydrogenase n=1 Tax=Actinomadura livida TaxID=79909 RepID=A0A7W7IL21_9ACTN|nr:MULTISPECIES: NAD(P)-dependent alcohol dehydrogenase [Actinomadura]MBB4778638.1 aryl-alcohol dehydrogenase [Actinomadura catellatispora]GGU30487.1 aryl-alcohol dehydrogenase [Actinomadura livida]